MGDYDAEDGCHHGLTHGCMPCLADAMERRAVSAEIERDIEQAEMAKLRAAAGEVRTHIEQNGECELCGYDADDSVSPTVRHHEGTVCEALAAALDAAPTEADYARGVQVEAGRVAAAEDDDGKA